jgi:hypothetical protein
MFSQLLLPHHTSTPLSMTTDEGEHPLNPRHSRAGGNLSTANAQIPILNGNDDSRTPHRHREVCVAC